MTTAIVILNWNGEAFLQEFLPTLINNTSNIDVEIIVADNASTDNSLSVLSSKFSTIRTIVLDKNYGFAGGYNRALAQVKADYYVILNSDIEVTSNWLEPLFGFMNKNLEVAACQPKIRSYSNRSFFEHAGAAGGFIDYLGFPFCRGRVFGIVEEDKGQYDSITSIFWATGACLMIRSDAFWSVGGFDDDFFAHMEEIDLCWRLKSRGYKIACIPQSVVYHVGGGTLNVESPYKTYLNFRNNLLLLYKNLSNEALNKIMFLRFFLDYIAFLQLFITGKPKNAISVIKARMDYKKMRSSFMHKRLENLSKTTHPIIQEILPQSIVISYFLRAKKTFQELIIKKAV